ncbi:Uncharacterised protein [Citrobacter werkmanii]|uniref:Uncharacterized protein n=1 Tax=Citrobacter werkmanii TaxID=67827 RepID=A0ABM8MW52_9ENTR|nr:Uncharacterised protein [Citrobacter werkmanii]CAC9191109.1 Uncharacterised protein [Citrobacter werkmanii]
MNILKEYFISPLFYFFKTSFIVSEGLPFTTAHELVM